MQSKVCRIEVRQIFYVNIFDIPVKCGYSNYDNKAEITEIIHEESWKTGMENVLKKIVDNMEKVIIGKREAVELVVMALAANGHVLIEDVPGVGKTTLVKALARSVNATFGRIQCTPDVLPSDITGFNMFNIKTGDMEYKEGLIFHNIILSDEINRASPKTQSSLLEVMEEGQVTIDGNTRKVPSPFMLLATQNPVEYAGTFPLPEAQLDRFMIKVSIGYPEYQHEFDMMEKMTKSSTLDKLMPVVTTDEILEIQKAVKSVYVGDLVRKYILDLITATRNDPSVLIGCSPRAGLQLLWASQAMAFYMGRDYVIPDDVQKMAQCVLAHRIMLRADAKIQGVSQEQVVMNTLWATKVPVE